MADAVERYKQYLIEQGNDPAVVERYANYLKQQNSDLGEQMDKGSQFDQIMAKSDQRIAKDTEKAGSVTAKGLDLLARGADYLGGFARMGVANQLDMMTGGPIRRGGDMLVKPEDVERAKWGKAPKSSEYMDRAGVPELGRIGKVTGRDVIGFGADIGTDPLTYSAPAIEFARGGTALDVLKNALNPANKLTEKAGTAYYKSAFKKIDRALKEEGVAPLSDLMLKNNVLGGAEKIETVIPQMKQQVMEQRLPKYQEAHDLGVRINPEVAAQDAMSYIDEAAKSDYANQDMLNHLREFAGKAIKPDPGKLAEAQAKFAEEQALAKSLMLPTKNKVEKLPVREKTIFESSADKTDLYAKAGESAYSKFGAVPSETSEVAKRLASGNRRQIEQRANQARPGLGDEIAGLNQDYATLAEAEYPMALLARREVGRNNFTPIDGAAVGAAFLNPKASAIGGMKKVAEFGNLMPVRTYGGWALMKTGQGGVVDPIIRQTLIETQRDENPWALISPSK